jgi:hypothetical protein
VAAGTVSTTVVVCANVRAPTSTPIPSANAEDPATKADRNGLNAPRAAGGRSQ